MPLVILNKGAGSKPKKFLLCEQVPILRRPFFWLKERLSAAPRSPLLPFPQVYNALP